MNKLTPSQFEWLPQIERKKILLLSDDLRFPSGVGTQAKEIVLGTAHRYNWVQVGAGVNHPEQGKIMDLSQAIGTEFGIKEPFVRIYPYNNYGDPFLIRTLLQNEKPDAIMIFTDPRQFIWLFEMEHEIRKNIPIIYYNIWDSTPYPMYNREYYRSCDALFAISKQTYNINKQVLGDNNYTLLPLHSTRAPVTLKTNKDAPILSYLPHGINSNVFYKITDEEELKTVVEMRERMFGKDDVEFVVLYNSRNLHRKMTGNVILAFNEFVKSLPIEKQKKVALIMHTHAVDGNGTDLVKIVKDCAPNIRVVFSQPGIPSDQLNRIYNIADIVINLSANEGFGLGTCEALMAEKMIIANVTGGLQDQMGFKDADGNYLDPDIHYVKEWGTNADGKYTAHGEWCVPVFPKVRSLKGSPPTPYIFDEIADYHDAAKAIQQVYEIPKETRAEYGKLARQFTFDQYLNTGEMCHRFVVGIDTAMNSFTPHQRFGVYKA